VAAEGARTDRGPFTDTPLPPESRAGTLSPPPSPPGERPPSAVVSRPRILGATSLAHFVNDGTTFFVPVIAALLTSEHGFAPLTISVLFVVFYTSSSVLSLFVGHLDDRVGHPARLIAVGLGLLGFGMLGFYGALNLVQGTGAVALALISALIVGFGTSFYHPLGATLLQRVYDPATRGKALGVNGALGSLGRTLYPFFFALLNLTLFSTDSLLVFVVIGWASALTVWQMIGPARPTVRAARATASASVRDALTHGILLLTAVAFLRSVATQAVAAWIPTYLVTQRGVSSPAELGFTVTLLFVGGILGQPFFGLLADRSDPRHLLSASSVGAALATLAYLALAGLAGVAMLFLIGFFTFSAFPILMSLSSDYAGPRSSSLSNALVFGLGAGGGGAVGPLLLGLIAAGSLRRLDIGFEAMVGLGLVAALAVAVLPKPARAVHVALFG
jgi:FSR family fosmidomycin resistance protein-like MFS transporter